MRSKRTKTIDDQNEKLLLACENADLKLVQRLLEDGAESTAVNSSGESPLHLAVKSGDRKMVEFVINELRIPTNIRDAFGRTPLHWAAQQGNVPVTECLLLAQANVEAKDDMGVEAKIYAEMAGHRELVKLFSLVRTSRK